MEAITVKVIRAIRSACYLFDESGNSLDHLWRQHPGVPLLYVDYGLDIQLLSEPPRRGSPFHWGRVQWQIDSRQHFMKETLTKEPVRVLLGTRKLPKVKLDELRSVEAGYSFERDSGILHIHVPLDRKRTLRIGWRGEIQAVPLDGYRPKGAEQASQ